MKFLLCNAFSLNMLRDKGQDIAFVPVTTQAVRNLLRNEQWESVVGHQGTANLFSAILGQPIRANRVNVQLVRGETSLIVGQYTGPRLQEGVTQLPAGAKLEWWQVYHPF